jgi:hypothetical protein
MASKSGLSVTNMEKKVIQQLIVKTCANDLLKGNLKESTNVAMVGDPADTKSSDDLTEELIFFTF